MSAEQLRLIIQLIDAKIAFAAAYRTSDGGLIESLRVRELIDELYAQVTP